MVELECVWVWDRGSYSVSHLKNKTKIIRRRHCWWNRWAHRVYFCLLRYRVHLHSNSAVLWCVLSKTKEQTNTNKYFDGYFSEMYYIFLPQFSWNLTWSFLFGLEFWSYIEWLVPVFDLCLFYIPSLSSKCHCLNKHLNRLSQQSHLLLPFELPMPGFLWEPKLYYKLSWAFYIMQIICILWRGKDLSCFFI